jgi:hypothetical protein
MVLAAEPVAPWHAGIVGITRNTWPIGVQLCWSNLKRASVSVSQLMVFLPMLMLSEPVGGTGQSRLHLARNIELPLVDHYGR